MFQAVDRSAPSGFRRAVIESGSRPDPDMTALVDRLAECGVDIVWCAQKDLTRNRITVDRHALPIGGLPFMAAAGAQLKIALPEPDDYPATLSTFVHRRIEATAIGRLRHQLTDHQPRFAKPRRDRKRFVGRVFTRPDDWPLPTLRSGLEVWCAEPVSWIGEFRVFVADGVVEGIHCYDGDALAALDRGVVDHCVQAVSATLDGYAIDVGVLATGETAVVEVNDGFALGLYGLPGDAGVRVLASRWRQLVASAGVPSSHRVTRCARTPDRSSGRRRRDTCTGRLCTCGSRSSMRGQRRRRRAR